MKELTTALKNYNFHSNQFAIIGSGPLAIRNIREASDLDVLVSDSLWQELEAKYPHKKESGVTKIQLEPDIEVVGEGSAYWNLEIASFQQMIDTADVIDGIRYLNLDILKKFKQKIGRDKDIKDIELIDNYQSQDRA